MKHAKVRAMNAVGARNHWYAPAVALRRDIEQTDGGAAGRAFITGVLRCSSPGEAMAYVTRRRTEWDAAAREGLAGHATP